MYLVTLSFIQLFIEFVLWILLNVEKKKINNEATETSQKYGFTNVFVS